MIYVVGVQDGKYVKIGHTKDGNVSTRIAELQTGSPYKIDFICSCDGTVRQEKTIHYMLFRAFNRIRIPHPPNEWYPGKVQFMRDFILNIEDGFNSAYTYLCKYQTEVKQSGKDLLGRELPLTDNVRWPTK